MMKLRIPTDQYAFLEIDFDGSIEEAKREYDRINEVFNNKRGDGDFYLYVTEIMNSDLTEWGSVEDYNLCSPGQQAVLQSIKRLKKRLQAKEE